MHSTYINHNVCVPGLGLGTYHPIISRVEEGSCYTQSLLVSMHSELDGGPGLLGHSRGRCLISAPEKQGGRSSGLLYPGPESKQMITQTSYCMGLSSASVGLWAVHIMSSKHARTAQLDRPLSTYLPPSSPPFGHNLLWAKDKPCLPVVIYPRRINVPTSTIADFRPQILSHIGLQTTSFEPSKLLSVTEPARASLFHPGRSSRGEDAVQSNPLWRNLRTEDTLADNYRVGGYSVDFTAGHGAHADDQSHLQQSYSSPSQPNPFQSSHQYSFNSQQQPRSSFHQSGVAGTSSGSNTSPEVSHGQPSSRSGLVGQQRSEQSTPTMQLEASQMSNSRMGHVAFGSATSVTTPMYPATASPSQGHASFVSNASKRIRNDDFDISMAGVPSLGQSSLDLPPNSIGAAYGQAAAAAAAASNVNSLSHQAQGPQLHHHHHLPDLGHLGKFMRREDGSGAPSMVGQAGMPPPAPRPRGPKLKFTAEDDQLLIELKEQRNLTWKQIADFFPGRSSGTLQVRYCTKLKAKTTQWTDEMDHKLRSALADYENEKWRIVAHKVGSGFTPTACRERAIQLMGDEDPDATWQSMSPRSASGVDEPEIIELPQIHRPWHE
ncbi:hypothetical protein QQS21_007743 [Conoideocrella luteorostrata]|uniref:MYB DNA-binding domain-containing protein n=1 Tax=Conoideocrella luteorostrata TaxID=1105319 RepID=A0AAJ0FWN6_9HYPO|nr:hypothetical protein QQS21_007743 [Conoideocrella luteorostrata]